jgi:hypothetical protein
MLSETINSYLRAIRIAYEEKKGRDFVPPFKEEEE